MDFCDNCEYKDMCDDTIAECPLTEDSEYGLSQWDLFED